MFDLAATRLESMIRIRKEALDFYDTPEAKVAQDLDSMTSFDKLLESRGSYANHSVMSYPEETRKGSLMMGPHHSNSEEKEQEPTPNLRV